MPKYLWLATGEKSHFTERLKVLHGSDVVAFPDVEKHIELADWLITWKLQPEIFETEMRNITYEKIKTLINEGY